MISRRKKVAFSLVLSVLAYTLIEAGAFGALQIVRVARPALLLDSFLIHHFKQIDEEYRQTFLKKNYDPILGWDIKPGTRGGGRNLLNQEWTISFDGEGARESHL